MTGEEKITYLANLAAIAAIDENPARPEGLAIQDVSEGIGAGQRELQKALEMVAKGDYSITLLGRYSDNIRNLEDMILVALRDGDFSKAEKPEIISFVKSIKITQDQLNQILSEVKARTQIKDSSGCCPSCGKQVPSDSKYCPFCGGKI